MKDNLNIVLYHGSNIVVKKPNLYVGGTSHDFGRAFYLTTNFNQAIKWSKHKFIISNPQIKGLNVKGIASRFLINKNSIELLKIKKFDSPNEEWLKYVIDNRFNKEYAITPNYDLVIGPVIDGRLSWETLHRYKDDKISFEETIKLVQPNNLKDQWAFKTEKALKFLTFGGVDYGN